MELQHHGVKGMKWGVRKRAYRPKSSRSNVRSLDRIAGTSTVAYENKQSVTAKILGRLFPKVSIEQMKFKDYTIRNLDGEKIGSVSTFEESPDSINVVWIGINEKYSGKGYAQSTMKSLIDNSKAKGYSKMTLEVPTNSPNARHIYEKLGFEEKGTPMLGSKDDVWGGLTEMVLDLNRNELQHHGVKGMKWGVRRYQFADGTRTPMGRKREAVKNSSGTKKVMKMASMKMSELTAKAATIATGKQYADTYLSKNTSFKRIQTSQEFENFAFYATYKKADSDKYMGLFGKNLTSRANAAAKAAEKKAAETGDENDISEAKALRNKADTTKVYQLSINATKKLKIPSDDNASYVMQGLLKNKSFKDDLDASIADSKEKMRRPTQQLLFNQAQKALRGDPSKMTKQDRIAVYKALNLSLTNHNDYEVRAQDAFYGALKKKGYNALLDYNDKEYSSYHAKRPMIVFDLGAVKLQSVAETNPKVVNKMYQKYNADRLMKDVPTNTFGYLARAGKKTVAECDSYIKHKVDSYLS